MSDQAQSVDSEYRSSWNTALYANEQLYEVQQWCQDAAMNHKYRDWAKALFRYRSILRPLMTDKEATDNLDTLKKLRRMSSNYTGSNEDHLFDELTAAEESLRIIQNERGLGFALDEVQQMVEGDDEGVDKLIGMMQQRNDMLQGLIAKQQEQEQEVDD